MNSASMEGMNDVDMLGLGRPGEAPHCSMQHRAAGLVEAEDEAARARISRNVVRQFHGRAAGCYLHDSRMMAFFADKTHHEAASCHEFRVCYNRRILGASQ